MSQQSRILPCRETNNPRMRVCGKIFFPEFPPDIPELLPIRVDRRKFSCQAHQNNFPQTDRETHEPFLREGHRGASPKVAGCSPGTLLPCSEERRCPNNRLEGSKTARRANSLCAAQPGGRPQVGKVGRLQRQRSQRPGFYGTQLPWFVFATFGRPFEELRPFASRFSCWLIVLTAMAQEEPAKLKIGIF